MSSIMIAESSRRGSPASTSTNQLDQTPTHLEPAESSPDYSCCPTAPVTAPVYLLSPDGSRLWLLDSTKPTNEAPPPYSNAQWRPRSSSYTTPRPTRPAGVRSASFPERSTWRSIIFGDEGVELTESTPLLPGQSRSRTSGWRRYWRPLGRGEYWRPLVHLLLVNLPFNLLLWLLLLAGSLVGTVLLITLPIGVVVWWLTLIIARWAASVEIKLQQHFHLWDSEISPRPVFYRLRELQTDDSNDSEATHVWDTRFLACSWDMLSDYTSYAAVVYFLLIKPLAMFFPTIAAIALFPVCLVLLPLLPIYLRATRNYGRWQARVALDSL